MRDKRQAVESAFFCVLEFVMSYKPCFFGGSVYSAYLLLSELCY